MALTIISWKGAARAAVAAGLVGGIASASLPVLAQELGRAPVAERPRPDYDAVGIRAGSFIFLPKLDVSETYNDNIFATQTNTDHDLITIVAPQLELNSDWNNHQLGFLIGAGIGRYLRSSDENYEDFNGAVNGRIDVRRDTQIEAGINYARGHEDRGSPDNVNGVNPTETERFSAQVGASNKWNRVTLDVGVATEVQDFDDVALSTGAVTNNDDRDLTKYNVSTRLGYEIQKEYEAFVSATYNTIDYDSGLDDNGFNRDSDGYEITLGASLDLSNGLLTGDVFAGYRSQDYDDAQLETISGPVVGASLTWNVTTLTSFTGGVTRTIQETTQSGASGYFDTRLDVGVDHELRRNILIGGDVAATNQKYRGNGRDDDQYEVGAYAKYLLNRNFAVSANYDFLRKNSNAAGSSYSQNQFLVKLTAQY